MKKVLVATCVVAMTAFAVTNASADTVDSARASAYGVNIGGSLLDGLIEREPEVTSVLPPGGLVSEDIITVPVDPVTVDGAGVVVANTSAESTIVPFLSEQQGDLAPIPGTGEDGGGLLGGLFDNLLGGLLGGGGGGLTGGGLPVGALSSTESDPVQAQQLLGGDDGGGGLLGGLLGGDLLGGLLNNEEGGDIADDEIVIPAVNAQALSRITDLNILVEDSALEGVLPDEVVTLLLDALLEIDTVQAEAVAVCVDNQVFFDTASNTLSLNDEPVSLIDDVLDLVADLDLLEGILDIDRNEVGVTADGNGVFVNALHVTVLGGGGLLGGGTPLDEVVPQSVDDGTVQAQQLLGGDGDGEEDALLDIVLGHAEVSGNACAAPPVAPTTSLVPTGEPRQSLPVTGGGFGALPALVSVGLLGGAVTAGRLALRARRNGSAS